MTPRLAILDYGMGNLRSVYKALEHVGGRPELTNDHARVREADGIVLPGVGAMPKAMQQVRALRLDELLRERVDAGVPLIGLCMGMQLLFESGCWRVPSRIWTRPGSGCPRSGGTPSPGGGAAS